jgi:hypothetical protein
MIEWLHAVEQPFDGLLVGELYGMALTFRAKTH